MRGFLTDGFERGDSAETLWAGFGSLGLADVMDGLLLGRTDRCCDLDSDELRGDRGSEDSGRHALHGPGGPGTSVSGSCLHTGPQTHANVGAR